MRRLVLIGTAVVALLIGSAAPVLGAHGATGCQTATEAAASQGAAAVAAACARGQ